MGDFRQWLYARIDVSISHPRITVSMLLCTVSIRDGTSSRKWVDCEPDAGPPTVLGATLSTLFFDYGNHLYAGAGDALPRRKLCNAALLRVTTVAAS